MARHRKASLGLSAERARQALAVLIQEGKLAASEVRGALQRRDRLVRALRASLAALETGVGKVGSFLRDRSLRTARKVGTPKRRRKPRISAVTRKIYQQQGRYMAALRPLTKQQRAKIKVIRAKSGVQAAISAARKMAK
jgi:hypothetical protein